MSDIVQIGRCKGCSESSRLEDGECETCRRARRRQTVARLSQRLKHDPDLALRVFNAIGGERPGREVLGKMLFIKMFGLPAGAVCPPQVRQVLDELYPGMLAPRRSGARR